MNSAIKTGVVPEFRGEYYFLSNYSHTPFVWRGIEFQWAEQAFAYAKTFFSPAHQQEIYQRDILEASSPGEAKKLGSRRGGLLLRTDEWDARRVQYMREIVHAKFMTGQNLVGPLLNTGVMMLVEGNDWNDKFWGRCLDKSTGKWVGLNTLGAILMEERGYWLHGNHEG